MDVSTYVCFQTLCSVHHAAQHQKALQEFMFVNKSKFQVEKRGKFHSTRLVPNIEYILERYNLAITLNAIKIWPPRNLFLFFFPPRFFFGGGGGEFAEKKKGKNVSRTNELSFKVWRSSILFSTPEASSEAGVLTSAR